MNSAPVPAGAGEAHLDPRRWVTLSILIMAVMLIAVDISVLNVAIPTILRELDTTVPTLQWVITGYSLTFATFLIVGGRLGDVYGHRRMFVIGAALFGVGSLLASIAPNVGVLILGEAIIEGLGAALLSPSSLAILSSTFRGRERATAFAVWGATIGAAVAFGPVFGGFLTTNYSWRWSFRINVVMAPIAIIGALRLIPRSPRGEKRPIDLPGAALIAVSMFLLVFALSEQGEYGWWRPVRSFAIGGVAVWPASRPVAISAVAFLASMAVLLAFVRYEIARFRRGTEPLFEFAPLRLRSFRYGLITLTILALGQFGLLFTLPLFLQTAGGLSAQTTGFWLLPLGLSVIIGAQLGGRLARRITPTTISRAGLIVQACSYIVVIRAIAPGVTFAEIIPGLVGFGIGIGFASSQLTNVVLAEVPLDQAGVASAANSTARQIGAALGASLIASLVSTRTIQHAVGLADSAAFDPAVRARFVAAVRASGPSTPPLGGLPASVATEVQRVLAESVAAGTRAAMAFGCAVVAVGAVTSMLIPRRLGPAEPISARSLTRPAPTDGSDAGGP
ncbi:MAG: MFS transporter [Actinomycetota bacterium]